MLSVELLRSLAREFRHFDFVNHKSFRLNCFNNFTDVLVAVWLDHSKRRLALNLELSLRGNITILLDNQDAAENCNSCSNEKVRQLEAWNFDSLQEDALLLLVIHFDGAVSREKEYSVWSVYVGLVVVPLAFENISLIFDWFCRHCLNFETAIN